MTITTTYDIGNNLYLIHEGVIKCVRVDAITTRSGSDGVKTTTYTFLDLGDYTRTDSQCFSTVDALLSSFGFTSERAAAGDGTTPDKTPGDTPGDTPDKTT